jgi:uncharacterized protein YjiK
MNKKNKNLITGLVAALTISSQVVLAQSDEPFLWITDDLTRTIYKTTLNGQLLDSFPSDITTNGNFFFSIFPSDITRDPITNTLWVIQIAPGRLVNYTKSGEQITVIDLETRFPNVGPEGVTVDFFDGTLWVVDDPANSSTPQTLYNLKRDGTLIRSFPSAKYSNQVSSQQAIASDPINGTLWITDNTSDRIYNVSTKGELLSSFCTNIRHSDPGDCTSQLNPPAKNIQGISVDSRNGTLWVSNRGGLLDPDSNRLYNVSITGEQISSFKTSIYDPRSKNATGVAFDNNPDTTPVAIEFFGLTGQTQITHVKKEVGDFLNGINAPNDILLGYSMGSFNGPDPGIPRVRSTGNGSYLANFDEFIYLNNRAHLSETLNLFAFNNGSYTLPDGTKIVAGTFKLSGTGKWKTINFPTTFENTPYLFLFPQTANGGQPASAIARNVTGVSFDGALIEEEALNRSGHVVEEIAYFAIDNPSGQGSIPLSDGTALDFMVTSMMVNHSWTPVFDRMIKIAEDQSKDNERVHIYEKVVVMKFLPTDQFYSQIVSRNGFDPATIKIK